MYLLLCTTIIFTTIPILRSLRLIEKDLSQLEKNTSELINKFNKTVDLIKKMVFYNNYKNLQLNKAISST